MKFAKTLMAVAIGSAGIVGAMSAHAVTLTNGDKLTITAGARATTAYGSPAAFATGSWFGMDTNGPGVISKTEQTLLASGTDGLVIGSTTAPGAYHGGASLPGDTGPFVASWDFASSTGTNYFNSAIGSAPVQTDATHINFDALDVAWNTSSSFNMGTGSWTPTNCANIGVACSGYADGSAVFSWDGTYGHAYTLDYSATVPSGGFAGTKYFMHLEGTVQPVPEASTYGMMLAGLGLVALAVRRRKLN
jgi:hypothetical protein